MNKITAGYKMLMVLANADGTHLEEEHALIVNYLGESYDPRTIGLAMESERIRLQAMPTDALMLEFREAMNAYFSQSSITERSSFLQLAMDLIKSDNHISKEENSFINKLFDAWGETE
ncbi:MAG: hypothetical protein C0424_05300 [Sphingobacteriaceae bacterium]|nr:hypothetical protein [Sphingobacteriaceae bacterium]